MSVTTTRSEEETREFGKAFAAKLVPGSVVAIYGDLGAGKTRLVQGICQGLGIPGHVASPTFTIVHEYRGKTATVFHFDFYRIRSLEEVAELGFEEYIRTDTICLLEWAEKVKPLLPVRRYDVTLALGKDSSERQITITEPTAITA